MPVKVYKMEATDKKFGFQSVTSDVTITISPAATYMALDYTQGGQPRTVQLKITKTEAGDCGSTHVYASLENTERDARGIATGPRYSVHLVDHSTRTCRDRKLYMFEATVRSGFGWCGTGDSTMTLRGNP
jgi:hypothetical protein